MVAPVFGASGRFFGSFFRLLTPVAIVVLRTGVVSLPVSQNTAMQAATVPNVADDAAQLAGDDIRVVFSDLDGTLIHYPDNLPPTDGDTIIRLPASSTGLAGIVSQRTFDLCRALRQKTPLYFVSGMRFTTLISRLPYLPRADAYCCDGGGRIFWARDSSGAGDDTDLLCITPQVNGETPFSLMEDTVWRKHVMEQHVGRDGYVGNELLGIDDATTVPIRVRDGPLWNFAQQLLEQGLVLDARGYASCFRINRKHQRDASLFDQLLVQLENGSMLPQGLATSTNLGCIDVYPTVSGKLNCCDYLARRLLPFSGASFSPLAAHAVCLCDDDNDVAMALACHHAYIPAATSRSMQATIQQYPDRFTLLYDGPEGEADLTKATERALEQLLQRLGIQDQ